MRSCQRETGHLESTSAFLSALFVIDPQCTGPHLAMRHLGRSLSNYFWAANMNEMVYKFLELSHSVSFWLLHFKTMLAATLPKIKMCLKMLQPKHQCAVNRAAWFIFSSQEPFFFSSHQSNDKCLSEDRACLMKWLKLSAAHKCRS